MESHRSVTLFLLLCLAFSVGRARPLGPPSASDPNASSELAPDASPEPKPVALSRLAPKTSPKPTESPRCGPSVSLTGGHAGSVAKNDMAAQVKGPSANDDVNPKPVALSRLAPKTSPKPTESPQRGPSVSPTGGPAGSVAMNDMAAQVKRPSKRPSANDAVNVAVKYVAELDGPMPSMEFVEDELVPAASAVKDKAAAMGPTVSSAKAKAAETGPAASAAMNKVAKKAAELKGPPINRPTVLISRFT